MITKNKTAKLLDLVDVRSGVYRKSITRGEVYQIQKGNFDEDGNFSPLPKWPELIMEESLRKHFLHGDEVLVTAKGEANTAYLFPEIDQHAVASSVFLILTIKRGDLLPPYLNWYLNTERCQFTLNQLSRGSSVHSLAKRDLQQLAIPLPPLHIQRSILKLAELQRQEQGLYQQLITEKSRLAEAQLLQLTGSTLSTSPAPASAPLTTSL